MHHTDKTKYLWHYQRNPCQHNGKDEEICGSPTHNLSYRSGSWLLCCVIVFLSTGTSQHTYTQQHGLLDDKHQYAWYNKVAVATSDIEYGHLIKLKWMH